ncbi:MAG: hypothetical protein AAF411_05870, partial [Myxococcota bacterium]
MVTATPNGIADLVGGTLVDDRERAYGTFVSPGDEGSYSLELTWDALNRAEPLTGPSRRLTARFFDQSGNTTARSFEVRAQCQQEDSFTCNGTCRNLMRDTENCGECGVRCEDSRCIDGACRAQVTFDEEGAGRTCATICVEAGFLCDPPNFSGFINSGGCQEPIANCDS